MRFKVVAGGSGVESLGMQSSQVEKQNMNEIWIV